MNQLDFLFFVLLFCGGMSFFVLSLRFGASTQFQFLATYVLPLSVYYYVRYDKTVSVGFIYSCLKLFTIISLVLTGVEFYSNNYIGVPIFSFSDHWNAIGVEGFHSSKTAYAFLGELVRPWGVMAIPQSSGTVFAALSVYFLSRHVNSLNRERYKIDIIFALLALIGVYISGSRTALVVEVLMLFIIFRKKGVVVLFFSMFVSTLIVYFFLMASKMSFSGYSGVIPSAIEGLTIGSVERLFDVMFGQGLNTIPGRMMIGLDEVHILNHLFTSGVMIYSIMSMIIFLFYYKYLRTILNHAGNVAARFVRHDYMAFSLFIISLMIGSLHYDALMRYPSNIIVLAMIGLISREYSVFKQLNVGSRVMCTNRISV